MALLLSESGHKHVLCILFKYVAEMNQIPCKAICDTFETACSPEDYGFPADASIYHHVTITYAVPTR